MVLAIFCFEIGEETVDAVIGAHEGETAYYGCAFDKQAHCTQFCWIVKQRQENEQA